MPTFKLVQRLSEDKKRSVWVIVSPFISRGFLGMTVISWVVFISSISRVLYEYPGKASRRAEDLVQYPYTTCFIRFAYKKATMNFGRKESSSSDGTTSCDHSSVGFGGT